MISRPAISMPLRGLSVMKSDSIWARIKNKYGEMGQPCLTPRFRLNLEEVPLFNLIEQFAFLYMVLIEEQKYGPKPIFSKTLRIVFYFVKSLTEIQE